MSEKLTSTSRFWETLQKKGSVKKGPFYQDPRAGLSDLAERLLKVLYVVQAATVFELQTRLGAESESETELAVRELEQRKLVTVSSRDKDIVVSLRD